MKILIFSDVHGNLPAFEKMLKEEKDCEQYICLGDLVNYGPWSNECVSLAKSLKDVTLIMGNHEEAFINGFYPGSNVLVQEFFNITYKTFKEFSVIKDFKEDHKLGIYTCSHTILNQYIYPDTNVVLDRNYLIGHSHHQFEYNNNGFVLFNTGSVGQNRMYINVINYLVYDTEVQLVEMKYLKYDVDLLINEMKSLNYPEICINYYNDKKRS